LVLFLFSVEVILFTPVILTGYLCCNSNNLWPGMLCDLCDFSVFFSLFNDMEKQYRKEPKEGITKNAEHDFSWY
jgi:hypothetical protein